MSIQSELSKALGKTYSTLTEKQVQQFKIFFDEMVEACEHTNLTSVLDEEGVAQKHFADSLMPWQLGLIKKGDKIMDVGAGAGLPGLPLKIVEPDLDVTLLEATGKKAVFIQEVAQAIGVDVTVLNGRAEEIAHNETYRMCYDSCVSRAVARLSVLLELTVGFVKLNGYVLAYKGEKAEEEIEQAKTAAQKLGLALKGVYKLKDSKENKCIVVYKRVEKLLDKYPRKFANIKKKSL